MRKEEREKLQNKRLAFVESRNESPAEIPPQAGTWERVTDTEPDGVQWEGLPAGIQDIIENAINDFCTYECKPPIADLAKERAPRWSACCQYIGHKVFKRYNILTNGESPRRGDGTRKPYNIDIMGAAVPVWRFFCARYEKAPLAYDYYCFVGASECYLIHTNGGQGVTPAHIQLAKTLKSIQEAGLAGLISDGRGNPTGAIAILNHWHGWNQTAAPQEKTAAAVLSVHDLPRLGSSESGNQG